MALDPLGRGLRYDHRIGRSRALNSGGEVDAFSDGGELVAIARAELPHHGLAGVKPDAHVKLDAEALPDCLIDALDLVEDAEGRSRRSHVVVFVGDWIPEERHDPVAGKFRGAIVFLRAAAAE